MADWSETEDEILVADYFAMLAAEQRNEAYSKAAHLRALMPRLPGRTKTAIERKHHNVSAILHELGCPSIDGYKPFGNFQRLLVDVVARRLRTNSELQELLRRNATASAAAPSIDDLTARLEEPPQSPKRPSKSSSHIARTAFGVNWLEVEWRNALLGRAGEDFVVKYEKVRLQHADKPDLAERVEHIPTTRGDGEGYDVRSFEVDGRDRLIEVKTTANNKDTPFFITRKELYVSKSLKRWYHLYRVFRFRRDAHFFMLRGALDETCLLDPDRFIGRAK